MKLKRALAHFRRRGKLDSTRLLRIIDADTREVLVSGLPPSKAAVEAALIVLGIELSLVSWFYPSMDMYGKRFSVGVQWAATTVQQFAGGTPWVRMSKSYLVQYDWNRARERRRDVCSSG